jgi:hypothetical protein
VLFRCPTFLQAVMHYYTMFTWHAPQQYFLIRNDFYFAMALALLFTFRAPSQLFDDIKSRLPSKKIIPSWNYSAPAFCAFFFLTLTRVSAISFHPFIYFKF